MAVGESPDASSPSSGGKALLEVARGEATQVEDWEHLGDLRGAPHVRRKDLAVEAAATAILGLSAIIDPRRADLDRARAEGHLAGTRLPVADHLRSARSIALLVAVDVVGHLGIEPSMVGSGTGAVARQVMALSISRVSPFVPV
jgi:hypothetical protein